MENPPQKAFYIPTHPHMMMEANEDERQIGLEVFFTDSQGIGGKLKKSPEDFIVNEVSIYPEEDETGDFTIAEIRVRNWETNRLIRQISRQLGISRKRVGFAGTKDKRGITTRLFSFKATPDHVRGISLKDVEILRLYPSKKGLDLGNLIGNNFSITIMDYDAEDVENRIKNIYQKLDELNGFPNFFGHQRFGSFRPITHLVGKMITRGDFKGAVHAYLGKPNGIEGEEAFLARKAIDSGENYKDALLKFPDHLGFEKAMLNKLVNDENDYIGAIEALPKNLQMMFVHAYQSYIFNRILSRRIKEGMLTDEPQIGDIVVPKDVRGSIEIKIMIVVKEANQEKIKKRIAENKAAITGCVPGYEPKLANGAMGEIEAKILEEEGVKEKNFIVPKIRELSSKGTRRALVAQVKDFNFELKEDSILFEFELLKGCYATSLLREFMKGDMLGY
jgi:tRNA pseudouridine13 synthase